MNNQTYTKEILEQKDISALLEILSDSKRILKAKTIKLSEIQIVFQSEQGYMYEFKGSKQTYILRIDLKNKVLVHNCEDFIRRGIRDYSLCKHFVKIFQILYEKEAKMILLDLLLHSWTLTDSDDYLKTI